MTGHLLVAVFVISCGSRSSPRVADRPAQPAHDHHAGHPNNGWALSGLVIALKSQQRTHEADEAREQLARAWSDADLTPVTTAFRAAEHEPASAMPSTHVAPRVIAHLDDRGPERFVNSLAPDYQGDSR